MSRVIIAYSIKWGNQKVKVDNADFKWLNSFRWSIRRGKDGRMYARRNDYRNSQSNYIDMHRLIMNFPKNKQVDHKDSDSLNNTRINLRVCTQNGNAKNQVLSKLSTTGFKGVSFDKSKGKFSCFITSNYKHIFGGYFDSPLDAAKKYNKLAIKHHGEFARLNKIK